MMNTNYISGNLWMLWILIGFTTMAQEITVSFANAQITNDGTHNFYDVDVMIASTTDFKLGSGQLYVNYNTAAFGENIFTNNKITYTQPDGSILDETYNGFNVYKDFILNDNTNSRVSLSFQQGLSSGAIQANNVTTAATILLHIKIQFTDINEQPMISFETGNIFLDQFYTACGPIASNESADCNAEPGIQIINDTFDSSNALDTTAPVLTLIGENPQEIILGAGYNELGATTDDDSPIQINSTDFMDVIGTYTIRYNSSDIVGNNAVEMTRRVNVVAVLSIDEEALDTIAIYPNPTSDYIHIKGFNNNEIQLTIFNSNGAIVKEEKVVQNPKKINIKMLPSGLYFMKIESMTKNYFTKLIVE